MIERPSATERAFELARSDRCQSIADIRKRLKEEGFGGDAFMGNSLIKQLREIIKARLGSSAG